MVTARNAAVRATTSTASPQRSTSGTLYTTLPGLARSRNHSRSCALDMGPTRRPSCTRAGEVASAIGGPDLRVLCPNGGDPVGQRAHRLREQHGRRLDLDAEPVVQPRNQLDGEDRVAAEVEEVVGWSDV